MTKLYLTFFVILTCTIHVSSQITFKGCTGILGDQDFYLSNTGTTDDSGNIRNTYETQPSDFTQSCPAGVCELRIIWNTSLDRWEIQLDNDGPLNTPDYTTAVMYYNTTPSLPNPPDLTLGSWVNAEGYCPETITTLTGSVQGNTLGNDEVALISNVSLYPNPSSNFIVVDGLTNTTTFNIYNLVGMHLKNGKISNKEKLNIQNLNNGIYLLKLENGTTFKFIKE